MPSRHPTDGPVVDVDDQRGVIRGTGFTSLPRDRFQPRPRAVLGTMTKHAALSRRILFLLVVLVFSASQAGCATGFVNYGREHAGHPMAELGGMKRPLEGVVLEPTEVDGAQYLPVALREARQSCQRTEPLELLIPLSDGAKEQVILREATITSGISGATVPVYGTISSRPPGLPRTAGLLPEDEKFTQWLARVDLEPKAISPIVLGYDRRMGLKAFYRLGGPEPKPRVTPIDVKSGWVCRSHIKHGLMVLLYIPAVAFDVVTFPVQFVLFLSTGH